MHRVVSRQCAGNWSVSLSSCCAHSKHKKAQGEVGLLHWGTYVVVCRDLPAPLLGWQLQPAREGKASAAALLRPFLVEGVFPFFFVFSQVLEVLCQSACTSLLPSAAACQLALLQATKYLGSSGRSFMILSMQSRMRVRNQRLQPTAAAIQP